MTKYRMATFKAVMLLRMPHIIQWVHYKTCSTTEPPVKVTTSKITCSSCLRHLFTWKYKRTPRAAEALKNCDRLDFGWPRVSLRFHARCEARSPRITSLNSFCNIWWTCFTFRFLMLLEKKVSESGYLSCGTEHNFACGTDRPELAEGSMSMTK